MKTKGITFWEQNIERFVIGLALLVCLALVAMQFIGEPNAVQVGANTVSPGEIDKQLAEKAEEIDAKLRAGSKYDFGPIGQPVFARFDERLNAPLLPDLTLTVTAPRPTMGAGTGTAEGKPYVVAQVPPPTNPVVKQHFDTIPEPVVASVEGLSAAIGTAPPHDVTWNTISAKFSIEDLLKQFSSGGPDGGLPLLLAWYSNSVDFIDLKVEREEMINGEWGNAQIIDPLPGYFSFRVQLKDKKLDDATRNWVLSMTRDPATRAQIIQPPFYETLTGSWVPPTGRQENLDAIAADDPAADLKVERDQLLARLNGIVKQLKDLGCPPSPPPAEAEPEPPAPTTPKGGGGGGAGAAPGSGIGSDSSGGQGLRSPTGSLNMDKCKTLWKRKARFEMLIAKADEEIARVTGEAQKVVEVVEETDEPETIIDVWAHDLQIQPGKTYRYRMSMEVYNPLFGRRLELIPEQQPLAEKFTMSSEPSAWSEPMTAQPPLRMFVTRALPSNPTAVGMALGQATAEVYRYHNGRWWLETFPVTPGDRIGDVKSSRSGTAIDYATDWYVLDIVQTNPSEERDSGYAASVLLQNIADPALVEWRMPRDETADIERRTLSGRVKLANLAGDEVASADTGRTEGSATN